jgi:hypothetical protein
MFDSSGVGVPTLDGSLPAAAVAAGREISERFYVEVPEAMDRYGARGRAYSDHDGAYLAAWAMEATELGAPELFERNVLWLRDLLAARGFPAAWFTRSVELAGEVLAERGHLTQTSVDAVVSPLVRELRATR